MLERKPRILNRAAFVLLVLLVACLSCVEPINLGTLSLGGTPLELKIGGEVDYYWQVKVLKDHQYEVVVERSNSTYPMNTLALHITTSQDNQIITGTESVTADSISNNFISPVDGLILVTIYSKVAERGEYVGAFQVSIREVTP